MKLKRGKTFIVIIILCKSLFPQSDSTDLTKGLVLESLISDDENESDDSGYPELLEELSASPVDLNEADVMELQKIPFIDAASANRIITHRNKYGRFFSINELYGVEGISSSLVDKILLFVKINKVQEADKKSTPAKSYKVKSRSRIISDLQKRKAFIENKYAGNQAKIYNRVIINLSDRFEAAVLTEKDAGESELNDFTSFYLKGKNIYGLEEFIAGDFRVELGQGLVFWSPYSLSKGSDAIVSVKKKGRGILPYRSVDENNFFRGAAAKFRLGRFSLLGFYSYNKFDAGVDTSGGYLNSMPLDGYHRTINEINRKKSSGRLAAGGALMFEIKDFAGLMLIHNYTKYDHYINSKNGAEFNTTSLSYDFYPGVINISGETAYDGNSAASINSILIPAGKKFKIISSIRIYPEKYFSPDAKGFGVRTNTSGETGFYTGVKYISSSGVFNLYYDHYKLSGASSLAFPSEGAGWYFGYNLKLKKSIISFSYKNTGKDEKDAGNFSSKKIIQQYKLELIYSPFKNIRLKSRAVYKNVFSKGAEINEGYLFFQDIYYNLDKAFSFYTRIILFNTDSFDAAVYEYENDAEGIFRSYALYGEGMRWYSLIKYRIINSIIISVKYSETYKPGVELMGSGNSIIYGNLDNSITLQLDLNF